MSVATWERIRNLVQWNQLKELPFIRVARLQEPTFQEPILMYRQYMT